MYSHNKFKYKVRCKYKALGTQQMPKPDTCAYDAVGTMLEAPVYSLIFASMLRSVSSVQLPV